MARPALKALVPDLDALTGYLVDELATMLAAAAAPRHPKVPD